VKDVTEQSTVGWQRVNDRTLLVLLQRPPANALGLPLIDGLRDAMDFADSLPGLRVVVVASRIPGIFAAGADIKHMVTADDDVFAQYGAALRPQIERFAGSDRITIAAVDGLALGGGTELAMACTLRVASAGASFGLPEVKLGLIPGAGGTQRLPRLIGRGRALDMMLTARRVSGQEALAMGLVDRLSENGEAEAEALRLADEIGQMSGSAQAAVVRCVDTSYDGPLPQGLAQEAAESAMLFADGDAREGLTAFIEKRKPRFG
jgi:enoyl-CoA hydratase